MDHHNQEHGDNQEGRLERNHRQTVESATTNLSSARFLSFEGQMYNTQHTPWGMDVLWRPYFGPTNQLQGMSSALQRRLLTFLKGQAHPQAAFDPYAWQGPLERYYGTGLSVSLGLLPAEDRLDALLNDPIDFNTLNESNMQTSQAQILHSGDVDSAYGRGSTSAELMLGPLLAGDVPNAISTSSRSSGIGGGPINYLDPTVNPNPRDVWANPLLHHNNHHNNTDVLNGWSNRGDGPAHDVVNIWSLRRRGNRLPPQEYQGNVLTLFYRLILEGASTHAAEILRDVIFAAGVTHTALMAPIQGRSMSIEYGGAKRMWQLLLEVKEVVPGKKKYLCLLCPVERCRGFNLDRDAVRHFNRDHFGFTFPCHCGRQFFRDSERKIHGKKCRSKRAEHA